MKARRYWESVVEELESVINDDILRI